MLEQMFVQRSEVTSRTRVLTYRLDVSVEEAHRVDGFDGLQDLLAQPQGGAHGERSSGLTPPQVGQVPPLQEDTPPTQSVTPQTSSEKSS